MQAVSIRRLAFLLPLPFLVLVFDAELVVAQGRPAAQSVVEPSSRADVTPTSVAVDSIVLSSPWFSPNDDEIQDTVGFAFAVKGPARAIVQIATAGQDDTLDVVLNDWKPAAGRQNVFGSWDGRDADGMAVPDGLYDLRFIEGDSLLTTFTSNTRRVEVDTVSPQIDSFRIDPRPFTPTLPTTPATLQIRFWLSRTQLDDGAGVEILNGEDTLRVALAGDFNGDGGYVAPCTTCADTLADGVHQVEIFAFDRAGNAEVAVDSIDTNLLGPSVTLSHPTTVSVFSTMQADSIVGSATDRQAVQSVSMLVSGALDTTLSLSLTPEMDGSQVDFFVDVSQLFADEGTYSLLFPGIDADGVSDSTRSLTYHVDRTPPPKPVLAPPLPQEIRSSVLDARVLVDTTASEFLLIEGAAIPINPVTIQSSVVEISLPLDLGTNLLSFRTVDAAGNESAAETASVVRAFDAGLSAPEQFRSGNTISLIPEGTASRVQVRILALDGSLVRLFENGASQDEYSFTWNLTTPEGLRVRNGAYLVVARVEGTGGTRRYHKMIAVIE